ncbi:NAD(P)H-binding protein [Mesonia aquimarina]|uniref:NAD(P)H-binding protein n=1 Tax=Mesonia aquimarina TaxID=1504967 RepID=UPI000EF5A385|nr:NAD(P)H-binding protein [Mesonia aquimarina]
MKTIGILGCGWLGFPLAKKLIGESYNVHGSTTSAEKVTDLAEEKINPFLIELTEEKVEGKIEEFLEDVKILIIDIPPGLRKDPSSNFTKKINLLIHFVEKSTVKKVIFVSSTSVFKDEFPFPTYSEKSKANGTSNSARQLIAVEQELLQHTAFSTTIIRFGGLIGEKRHPVKFLAGREKLSNGKAPINLIHQQDSIDLIVACINKVTNAKILHGVFPYHPSKEEYYTQKAKKLNLIPPHFSRSKKATGKIISAEESLHTLNIKFEYQP